MLTNAHIWREAQERLRPQMTRAQFDTWLRGTRLSTLEQGAAMLAVRTTFAKELLESQCGRSPGDASGRVGRRSGTREHAGGEQEPELHARA
jgi:chromosomal replication initiation ATPase DnaA